MKRVIVMILSLAVMLSGTAVFAAAPDAGYKFTDLVYGEGTYVALAKDENLRKAYLYYSTDGITWQQTKNEPTDLKTGLEIFANKNSQQQLEYWADKGMFVVHSANSTYTSDDGITWNKDYNNELHWSSNSMITTIGNQYITVAGRNISNSDLNVTSKGTKHLIESLPTNYYAMTVAAKPVDENRRIHIFINGYTNPYDIYLNVANNTYSDFQNNQGAGMQAPYDMVYAKGANQFVSVDGSENICAAIDSKNITKFTIKPNVNVTGVNASDKYIVVGMSDGTMYYTNNAPITRYTVWTEIKPLAGASAGTEPVKNFAFSSDSEFVALGTTQIYKGSIDGYCNVSEYNTLPQISTPDFSQEVISQNDGYHAKTASFEITQANDKIKGVKVTVNGESQTKSLANVDATMKFGIILISDNAEKLDNAQVSVQMLTE